MGYAMPSPNLIGVASLSIAANVYTHAQKVLCACAVEFPKQQDRGDIVIFALGFGYILLGVFKH